MNSKKHKLEVNENINNTENLPVLLVVFTSLMSHRVEFTCTVLDSLRTLFSICCYGMCTVECTTCSLSLSVLKWITQ